MRRHPPSKLSIAPSAGNSSRATLEGFTAIDDRNAALTGINQEQIARATAHPPAAAASAGAGATPVQDIEVA
jgi:hypothetical protein